MLYRSKHGSLDGERQQGHGECSGPGMGWLAALAPSEQATGCRRGEGQGKGGRAKTMLEQFTSTACCEGVRAQACGRSVCLALDVQVSKCVWRSEHAL